MQTPHIVCEEIGRDFLKGTELKCDGFTDLELELLSPDICFFILSTKSNNVVLPWVHITIFAYNPNNLFLAEELWCSESFSNYRSIWNYS